MRIVKMNKPLVECTVNTSRLGLDDTQFQLRSDDVKYRPNDANQNGILTMNNMTRMNLDNIANFCYQHRKSRNIALHFANWDANNLP